MKLFMFFYNLHRHCEAKIDMQHGYVSYRKRAMYALVGGIARAGVFLIS